MKFFCTSIIRVPDESFSSFAVVVDVSVERREVHRRVATAVATPVAVAIDEGVDEVRAIFRRNNWTKFQKLEVVELPSMSNLPKNPTTFHKNYLLELS